MKSHGKVAATTGHLRKTEGIEGSNRIVTMYYRFENMRCDELLR